ncbi:hypothetical protein BHE74_00033924 [Ensete ventricosum]|nr:hypothetical protein BHE74_00033924 [Ensete ventricosum]
MFYINRITGQPAGMAHEHVLSHAATWLLWCSIDTEATPYRALILGLKHALKRGFKQIHVRSVSQLLGMQVCNSTCYIVFDYNFFLTVDG